jgi:sorting nexin-8
MSLFGSSPDESSITKSNGQQQSKGLFDDDDEPTPNGGNSLFADDTGGSPWSMPAPKKAGRNELIKNLIPATEAPESYVDAFDTLLANGEGINGKITQAGITKLLSNSNLPSSDQESIIKIVAPGGVPDIGLERGPFNVLIALIGLAQEGEEATLDGVDERRKSKIIIYRVLPKLTVRRFARTIATLSSKSEAIERG